MKKYFLIVIFLIIIIGVILWYVINYNLHKSQQGLNFRNSYGLRNIGNKTITVKPFNVYPQSISLKGVVGPFGCKVITDYSLTSMIPHKQILVEWGGANDEHKFKKMLNVVLPEMFIKQPEKLHRIFFNIDNDKCFVTYLIIDKEEPFIWHEILQNGNMFNYTKAREKNGHAAWVKELDKQKKLNKKLVPVESGSMFKSQDELEKARKIEEAPMFGDG